MHVASERRQGQNREAGDQDQKPNQQRRPGGFEGKPNPGLSVEIARFSGLVAGKNMDTGIDQQT